MEIEAPKILNIPRKLLPVITKLNNYRYFLLEGGRSSGKSQTIARLISYLCDVKSLRIVCGRETQNSIDESVYTVFVDLIKAENLAYQIFSTEVRHVRNDSKINFRGFREQGKHNIKGLEGVDVLWVDEAQAITKETLEIIVPTIRKDNAKIFFSMNRFTEEDAVYNEFWDRPDCLHIHIDYMENEFCPQAMIEEARLCKQRNIEDYNHIWLGTPRKNGGIVNVVPKSIYDELKGIKIHREFSKKVLSGDPSLGGDECVAYIMDGYGQRIDELFLHERDEMKIAGLWTAFANSYSVNDFIIDVVGMKGIADRIRELKPECDMIECWGQGKSNYPDDYLNQRAEIYMYAGKEIINKKVEYWDDPVMIKQLTNVRVKPITSRKVKIEDKNDIRKRLQCSPDRSDTYVMGIWALQFIEPENEIDRYLSETKAGNYMTA